MTTISKDLIAATTAPIVLTILQQGDDYGYSIIKKVQELSDEKLEWKEGSLYPVLKKMEVKGLIRSYLIKSNGRNRKYYSIEPAGGERLKSMTHEWSEIIKILDKLWNNKTALTWT